MKIFDFGDVPANKHLIDIIEENITVDKVHIKYCIPQHFHWVRLIKDNLTIESVITDELLEDRRFHIVRDVLLKMGAEVGQQGAEA